jgi:Gram-negative bacterial TonB protein C-terminal
MKPALALVTLFVVLPFNFVQKSSAQDVKVRERAEHLLERANAVSSSPHLPNLERIDTFRVFEDGSVKEGSFSHVVMQGTGRRDEYTFADYHLLNVWTQKQVAVVGGGGHLLPPELVNVLRITPIWLVRFDGEDVIHSINDRKVNGSDAHCIEFDTVRGEKTAANELCVDATTGALVLEKLYGEVVENSDFFAFAGALMPGKITYSAGGVHTEITQTMTPLTDAGANVLAAPENAQMHGLCATYRRPFGISMPQPKAGNGGRTDDIIVRGYVGMDGKMFEPAVQSSERPELNAEALTVAKQWTFTPAMCNGKPDVHEAEITLHFQGR